MKTYSPRPRDVERHWYVLDANGAVLGRLASEAAKLLRGKHKPIFAPHADVGDHVIVINAKGVVLTGGKEEKKTYYRHSGYPGGIRAVGYARLLSERPRVVVEKAIRGMLPKTRLGRQMFRKLAVYEGPEHPHQAQKPVPLGLGEVPKWEGLPQPTPPAVREGKPAPEAKPARSRPGRPTRAGDGSSAEAKPSAAKRSTARAATAKASTAKKSTARARTAKESTAKASTARRTGPAKPKPSEKDENGSAGRSPRRAKRTKET
jgi:large subunit ribosomal protein L13